MLGFDRSPAGKDSPGRPSTSEKWSYLVLSLTFILIISDLIEILASIVAWWDVSLVTAVSLSLKIFSRSRSRPRPQLPVLAGDEADQRSSGQISGGQDGLAGCWLRLVMMVACRRNIETDTSQHTLALSLYLLCKSMMIWTICNISLVRIVIVIIPRLTWAACEGGRDSRPAQIRDGSSSLTVSSQPASLNKNSSLLARSDLLLSQWQRTAILHPAVCTVIQMIFK